jgi:gamma-glutamylputrescine oxidase
VWYLPHHERKQLRADVSTDVVIVGGGMAGLSAAQAFAKKGCSVIILEKSFCGAGASSKSSGFITPDSEFSLGSFVERYGPEKAQQLWEFLRFGVGSIKDTVERNKIECGNSVQDTLVVTSSKRDYEKRLIYEYKARMHLGYDTVLYAEIAEVLSAQNYYGSISYGETFGISGYHYLQGLKKALEEQSVKIYEETPALELRKQQVITPYGSVHAHYIVLCMDRFAPDLGSFTD